MNTDIAERVFETLVQAALTSRDGFDPELRMIADHRLRRVCGSRGTNGK